MRHPDGTRLLIKLAGEPSVMQLLPLSQVPFRVLVKGLLTGNTTEVVFLLHSPTTFYPVLKHPRDNPDAPACQVVISGRVIDFFSSNNVDETFPVDLLALRENIAPHVYQVFLFRAPSTLPSIAKVWV
ncbi:hypothetical protein ES703_86187 [subsurface metagenome]